MQNFGDERTIISFHLVIPWLCGGDFNEFIWDFEKSSGTKVLYNKPRYLEEYMNAMKLMDLDFNGLAFTLQDRWPNTRLPMGWSLVLITVRLLYKLIRLVEGGEIFFHLRYSGQMRMSVKR